MAATLEVIDEGGASAVSMRAVGRVLGVDAKSLYNHVDGKDDLLDAVTEYVLGTIRLPARTGDPETDLKGIARAFRERTLDHPEAAALVLTRQLGSVQALAPPEQVLEILHELGVPPTDAVHMLRAMLALLMGVLLREADAGPTFGSSDEDIIGHRRTALEATGLPGVSRAADALARFDADAEFDYAIDLAVRAVLRRIAERH